MTKPYQPKNEQLNRHSPAIGLVGLCHNIFKSSSSRDKLSHEAGIISEGLFTMLGRLSVAIKTRAIEQEKEHLHCTLLQYMLLSKITGGWVG